MTTERATHPLIGITFLESPSFKAACSLFRYHIASSPSSSIFSLPRTLAPQVSITLIPALLLRLPEPLLLNLQDYRQTTPKKFCSYLILYITNPLSLLELFFLFTRPLPYLSQAHTLLPKLLEFQQLEPLSGPWLSHLPI